MKEIDLVLPGEILEPDWPGTRCKVCGRPMGGDTVYEGWATCDDVPQAHNTMDQVPREVLDKYYLEQIWSIAYRNGLVAAIEYMTTPKQEFADTPLNLCKLGKGETVLRKIYADNEILVKELAGSRGIKL